MYGDFLPWFGWVGLGWVGEVAKLNFELKSIGGADPSCW